MSAVRAAAFTTMWATVMGSSGPAVAAGTTCQLGTGVRGWRGLVWELQAPLAWTAQASVCVHTGGLSGTLVCTTLTPTSSPAPPTQAQPPHSHTSSRCGPNAGHTECPWRGLRKDMPISPRLKLRWLYRNEGEHLHPPALAMGQGKGPRQVGPPSWRKGHLWERRGNKRREQGWSETTLGPLFSGPLAVVT